MLSVPNSADADTQRSRHIYVELEDLLEIGSLPKRVDVIDRIREILKKAQVDEADTLRVVWDDDVVRTLDRNASGQKGASPKSTARWHLVSARSAERAAELGRLLERTEGVRQVFVEPDVQSPTAGLETRGIERACLSPPVIPTPLENHLLAAPEGLNGRFGWQYAGGNGKDVKLIIVELGWSSNGPELSHLGVGSGGSVSNQNHGRRTLGVVGAKDQSPTAPDVINELDTVSFPWPGLVGMVPESTVEMVQESNWVTEVGNKIASMSASTKAVVLLEIEYVGTVYGSSGNFPMDLNPAVMSLFAAGGEKAWFVLPMGNGGQNLDSFYDQFEASNTIVPAVRVSSAEWSAPTWSPKSGTNYATVHTSCFGPGQVFTVKDEGSVLDYGTYFDTSAASAVVAGVVTSLRGLDAKHGDTLTLVELLGAFAANGTPVATATSTQRVPDLGGVVRDFLSLPVGDVFVRDNVADTGAVTSTGVLCASPDILIDSSDPSGLPPPGDDAMVGSGAIVEGEPAWLRVRMKNRQPAQTVRNVLVRLYYANVSSFATPASWNYIGTTWVEAVTGAYTISLPVLWDTTSVATGHYCFIAQLDAGSDPMPDQVVITSASEFVQFVAENNNIAWRNFNIVEPSSPSSMTFPFLVQGLPAKPERYDVIVQANLPKGARLAILGEPRVLARFHRRGEGTAKRLIEVDPNGRTMLGQIVIGNDERLALDMRVDVPDGVTGCYDVAVVQRFRRHHVGRVTWRILRDAKVKPKSDC